MTDEQFATLRQDLLTCFMIGLSALCLVSNVVIYSLGGKSISLLAVGFILFLTAGLLQSKPVFRTLMNTSYKPK